MIFNSDISENYLIETYPGVLDILLYDISSKNNIIWATNNYSYLGKKYNFECQITIDLVSGKNNNIIVPRTKKDEVIKQSRAREMAEIFTSANICNNQLNLIDDHWFGYKNSFNKKTSSRNSKYSWITSKQKVKFNSNTWKDYVNSKRLEICCGEGPYLTSRYDSYSGNFIEVIDRIGLIDRKLRVVNENTKNKDEWVKFAALSYCSTYGYEWQGDSLLLARESLLISFIENYSLKFNENPSLEIVLKIAKIISSNIWQMDGTKYVIPNSCKKISMKEFDLFENEKINYKDCPGCIDSKKKHNGVYSIIIEWNTKDPFDDKNIKHIKFSDLIKKQ